MKNKVIIISLIILISVYIGYHAFSKENNPIKDISNMEILAVTVYNHERRKSVIMNECVSPNEDINDPNLYNYELKEKVMDFLKTVVVNFNYTVEGSKKYNVNAYTIEVDVIYNSRLETIYIYFRDDHNSIHVATYSNESSVIESYDEDLLSTILENIASETSGVGFSYDTKNC